MFKLQIALYIEIALHVFSNCQKSDIWFFGLRWGCVYFGFQVWRRVLDGVFPRLLSRIWGCNSTLNIFRLNLDGHWTAFDLNFSIARRRWAFAHLVQTLTTMARLTWPNIWRSLSERWGSRTSNGTVIVLSHSGFLASVLVAAETISTYFLQIHRFVRLPHKQPKETQQPQNPSITTHDHLLVPADVTTRGGRTLRRLIFHPGRSEVPGFLKKTIISLFLVCSVSDDYLSQVIICLSQEHRRSKRDRKVGDDKYLRIHQTNEIGNQS